MKRDEILHTLSSNREELSKFGVKSIGVFGLAATMDEIGQFDDLDVFVELDPDAPVGLFEFVDLKDYLEELLGREIVLSEPEGLRQWRRGHYMKDAIYA